jgi:hypothetical protein
MLKVKLVLIQSDMPTSMVFDMLIILPIATVVKIQSSVIIAGAVDIVNPRKNVCASVNVESAPIADRAFSIVCAKQKLLANSICLLQAMMLRPNMRTKMSALL